jgi:WD40 repeat protein/transcriptional regulator with XRE-family HTH domain
MATPAVALEKFTTFGDLLKYLRRRVGLTQRELSIAVGYSDAQISRLEQNQRLPDLPTIAARFVTALELEREPEIVDRLLELAAEVRREDAPALGLPPFKGLLYFEEGDADLFSGREELTARLAGRLVNSIAGGERFLAVVGASGSGKSSVMRAGLISTLRWRTSSAGWPIYLLTPSARPIEALAASLTQETGSVVATANLADDLTADTRSLHLAIRRVVQGIRGSHALVVVDQFEELFTLCRSQSEQKAFVGNLLTAALEPDGPTIVAIALRADFYAHCADFTNLREALARNQEYIGPMTPGELKSAIEEPARRGHWELEPGLVDLLLHDVGEEPGALPLLSHALLETWQRRRGQTLTLSGYLASGGVRGAIAETAEAVFKDRLNQEQRTIARQIFLRLTELGEGTQDTRRRAALVELVPGADEQGAVDVVLKTLVDARLITTGEGTAEVAHEALIREWPTLREWLAEDREGLRLHRHLTESAQEWDALKRDAGALYRGSRLARATEWASTHRDELNALEGAFLQASQEWAEREAAEREAQRQRELDAAQRLAETEKRRAEEQAGAARRLRRRALLLTAALLVVGVLAAVALLLARQARQESQLSASRELAAAAISNLDVDPELSVLLALQAVTTTYGVDNTWTTEAENSLHRALLASHVRLTLAGHKAQVWSVAYSPDGTRLVTASQDHTAKVWDSATGKEMMTLQGHTAPVNTVAYSADGTRIATGSDDHTAKIWDASSGAELFTITGHGDAIFRVEFSPDSLRVVTAGADKTARIWDVATGKLLTTVTHDDAVLDATFSPDGSKIATNSWDGTVKMWDASSGKEVRTFIDQPGDNSSVDFSADGKRIAAGWFPPQGVKIWEVATGTELLTLSGHNNLVFDVAFGPDDPGSPSGAGGTLATSGLDRKVKVWALNVGRELFTLSGHTGAVNNIAFSPDGKSLATASPDGTAKIWDVTAGHELLAMPGQGRVAWSPDGTRLVEGFQNGPSKIWDASTGKELVTLAGRNVTAANLAFSPDSKRVATADIDGNAVIWDALTGKELFTLSGHTSNVEGVAFSPDGTRIATAAHDHTAKIWEASTGKELMTLTGHQTEVVSVVFSPDSTRLVTGDVEGTAILWDAVTGKQIGDFRGHTDTIWSVAYSPDGTRLVTGSRDGTARIWDALTGKELFTLSGHTGTVVGVAFNPDSKRVATGSRDGTAKVWDALTGKELLTLYGGSFGAGGVAFSPDGKRLAVAGDDAVRLYALDLNDLVSLARSRVTRALTTEECQRYLHVAQCPSSP